MTVAGIEVPERSWLEVAHDEGLACVMIAGLAETGPVCLMATIDPAKRLRELQEAHWREVLLLESLWFQDRAIAARVEKRVWRLMDEAGKRARPGSRWAAVPVGWAAGTVLVAAKQEGARCVRQEAVRAALARGWVRKNLGDGGLDGIEVSG